MCSYPWLDVVLKKLHHGDPTCTPNMIWQYIANQSWQPYGSSWFPDESFWRLLRFSGCLLHTVCWFAIWDLLVLCNPIRLAFNTTWFSIGSSHYKGPYVFLKYWSEVINWINLLSRLIRINPSKWGIMPTMMMLFGRKTLGRTQQIMPRDDVWEKLGRFLRLHWDIGFVMSDICGEKCQDLRPKKSCLFLSGHHIFQDWNIMKIIQFLRVAVPQRSCLSSSCQGSHENSRFEVFRPLSCGQVLPCLPLRQLWGCGNGKWALGEWSTNHTVLAWICRGRCIYLSGAD